MGALLGTKQGNRWIGGLIGAKIRLTSSGPPNVAVSPSYPAPWTLTAGQYYVISQWLVLTNAKESDLTITSSSTSYVQVSYESGVGVWLAYAVKAGSAYLTVKVAGGNMIMIQVKVT